MADETENLILRLLREIRATQGEHTEKLLEHDRRFDELRKTTQDWKETTATGVGFAAHANIRTEAFDREIEGLKRRIDRLEGAERH